MNNSRESAVSRLSRVDLSRLPMDGGEKYNRLIFEKSPYLLQHAENPVGWRPWGKEAFACAAAENKPVFLSIGYSTCHWCHVMAHESFEDEEVARTVNQNYVPVKVDREERPDVDSTYMSVCQMMTGSGGWPLTLVLTPDRKPFFAATYLPKRSQRGVPGLIEILEKIAELWRTDRDGLLRTGEEARKALLQLESIAEKAGSLDEAPLKNAFRQFQKTFDRQFGGFGQGPKFPTPHNISLLLRIGKRTGEQKAGIMALQTLQALRMGGIFDHLGFGIHRYSVDSQWLVPHFEKMLYDQALAVLAYLEAFQFTRDQFFAQSAREILEYLLRDLAAEEGGFYCGEDADSQGAEGTFYLWTPEQVTGILGADLGTVFCRSYGITEQGNFEGKSIPHLREDITELSRRLGIEENELSVGLAEARNLLFQAREKRVRPHRDDKVLTGWNGLAIAALARAAAVLDDRRYLAAAWRAEAFIRGHLREKSGRLLRRWRMGEPAVPAFLEDYAFYGWGLIELYTAGFDTEHLKAAVALADETETLFRDGNGSYYDTGADAEKVLIRGKSLQDGAIPSGISVFAWNVLRLGRMTGIRSLEEKGETLIGLHLEQANRFPSAFSQFLIALDFALGPVSEFVLAQKAGEELPEEILRVLRSRFLPRTVLLLHRSGDEDLERLAPFTREMNPVNEGAAAYLCQDRTCRAPVVGANELSGLLDGTAT